MSSALRGVVCAALLLGASRGINAAEPAKLVVSKHVLSGPLQPIRKDAQPVYQVVRATKAPVIDGKLDEWKDVPAITLDRQDQLRGGKWSGPVDLSGSLRMQWDEQGLYFALDVTDDVVSPVDTKSFWENDCTQFVFDTLLNGPESSFDALDLSYCASRDGSGPVLAHYRRVGRDAETAGAFKDKTIKFSQREHGYVYEWFLPWERFGPLSPWLLGACGFSFTLNDSDGSGYEGALAWTEGAIYGLRAGALGRLVFDGALGSRDAVLVLPPESRRREAQAPQSRWLETEGAAAAKSARLIVHSLARCVFEGTVSVYAPGRRQAIAVGKTRTRIGAGETTVFRWDLSLLPQGRYRVVYDYVVAGLPKGRDEFEYEQTEGPPYPLVSPDWVAGYRVRYLLRVEGNPAEQAQETIIASVPTGGWLKTDYGDLDLRTFSGEQVPHMVLSHDARGETMLQFHRHEDDVWYWLYASNPKAPPRDTELFKRIDVMKLDAQKAILAKMALAKTSAQRAAELRDLSARIERENATLASATKELQNWDMLLPERIAAAAKAAPLVAPAQEAARKAELAHAPFRKVADEKSTIAAPLIRDAAAARQAAQQAAAAAEAAIRASKDAEVAMEHSKSAGKTALETSKRAQDELAAAQTRLSTAKGEADAAAAAAKQGTEANKASLAATAAQKKAVADQLTQFVAAKTQAAATADAALEAAKKAFLVSRDAAAARSAEIAPAQQKQAAAEKLAAEKEPPAKKASDEAQAARLAAAPTETAKAAADATLAQRVAEAQATAKAVVDARARIAEVTKLRDVTKQTLAELTPKLPPIESAAKAASSAAERAAAASTEKEQRYFDFAHNADPRLYKEGLTVEFRQWEGDKLSSWAAAVGGLQKSDNILGSAVVAEVVQNVNPFRRSDIRNFAASYRGYLKIDTPGIYSFFVNGDDTTFLFVNGYKVYSRTGSNPPIRGRVGLYSVGADIQLEAGVHPFEVHHVIGNTPTAEGICNLLWLTPGAKQWQIVPRDRFTSSMLATVADMESYDGRQLATFEFGMDDVLSADGLSLYLARLQTQGRPTHPADLRWDFGDGTKGRGRVYNHAFFAGGDYEVSLKSHPELPPFKRRCHAWIPPSPTSPHSLPSAVAVLGKLNVAELDVEQLNEMLHFLLICQQSSRWPALERVCQQLLKQKHLDLKYRTLAYTAQMRAMSAQGRGAAAIKLAAKALEEVGSVQTLRALVLLEQADLNRDYLRDYQEADRLYAKLIEENRRLRHPLVRQAAVNWGDMFIDSGDLARAAGAFRLARTLSASGFAPEAQGDPVTQGALLRVAEQQLKEGNIHQTHRLLERIESEFPEQKLEGLYRFLRGESQRNAGRYELAIRDYEVLLQLRQWASYRPNALFGIADSYYRMGEASKAADWLEELSSSFPVFLKQRNLDGYAGEIQARSKRRATVRPVAAPKAASDDEEFSSTLVGFEPGESPTANYPSTWQAVRTLAIQGRYALRGSGQLNLSPIELKNLPTQGSLWVELWYRSWMGFPASHQHVLRVIASARNGKGEKVSEAAAYPVCTYGQWHKVAISLVLPQSRDGSVLVELFSGLGVIEIDRIRVAHVSDRENDALRSFIEGADPQ